MNSNLKTLRKSALALLPATFLVGTFAASSALADDQVRSETVRFADLDAGTLTGAHALYGRIHSAALRVCVEPDPRGALVCAAMAERRAIKQLSLPLLTTYYRQSAEGRNR